MNTPCPDCSAPIEIIDDIHVGDIAECDECGAEVEILQTDPLEVEKIIEEK